MTTTRSCLTVICVTFLYLTPFYIFSPSQRSILVTENRSRTDFPSFEYVNARLLSRSIRAYFAQIGHFLEDNFPLRSQMLIAVSRIYHEFNDSINPGICFLGKDKWLFLGNAYNRTISKTTGAISLQNNAPFLDRTTKTYKRFADDAYQRQARFVVFIGPDKQSIYPEYLPEIIKPASSRYIQPLVAALIREKIEVYDPTEYLLQHKSNQLLYYKRDTHWNNIGALVAANGFLKYLGAHEIQRPKYTTMPGYRGDLLHLGGYYDEQTFLEDRFEMQPNSLIVKKDTRRIWLFGDSFSVALQPILSAAFSDVQTFKHSEYQKQIKSKGPVPDLVIYEVVERDCDSVHE